MGRKKKKKKTQRKKKKKKKKRLIKAALPLVLSMDLHCVECANKIQRSILKIRGVEGVAIDMTKNEVTIKGVVEPQALCNRIMKKEKRRVKILSPLPEAAGEPLPKVVNSQVSGLTRMELNVNMHCEACAQLKNKILKMKGVRTAETELTSGKVAVMGTMDADKLVDYVYRRTKKQAKIVPHPEAEKPPEEKKEEIVSEEAKPAEEEKKMEEENKEEGGAKAEEEVKSVEEQSMYKMMHNYQPVYVVQRIIPPAPQLFSDENPNACTIM